jgi:hypothetical protein
MNKAQILANITGRIVTQDADGKVCIHHETPTQGNLNKWWVSEDCGETPIDNLFGENVDWKQCIAYPQPMPPALEAEVYKGVTHWTWGIEFPGAYHRLTPLKPYTTERAAKKGLLRFAERHNLNIEITP